MQSPIFEKDGEWFFCDETWAYSYGPYESKEIVQRALENYCEICLNGNFFPEPIFINLMKKENQ